MAAQALGTGPASIQGLHAARGRGETTGFAVPAVNIRMTTQDTARALFRAAKWKKAFGPFKAELRGLPAARRKRITRDLPAKFEFLMDQRGSPVSARRRRAS